MQESIQRYCCVNMRNSKYLSCRPFQFFKKNTYAYGLGPDQSHYNQSRLWSRLHNTLTQITRISPKWLYTEYTALKLFSPGVWATCACPEKQSLPRNFSLYWIYFSHSEFLSNLRWKTVCPEFTVLNTFYHSGFLRNLRLPWKTELPWKFSLCWSVFIILDFWATCACPENIVSLEIFNPAGEGIPALPRLERLLLPLTTLLR